MRLDRRERSPEKGVSRHFSKIWCFILRLLVLLNLLSIGTRRRKLGTLDQSLPKAVGAEVLLGKVRRESLLACRSEAARLLTYQRLRRFRRLDPLTVLRIPLENIEKLARVLRISAKLHRSVVLVRSCLLVAVVKGQVIVLTRPHVELFELLLVGALMEISVDSWRLKFSLSQFTIQTRRHIRVLDELAGRPGHIL